MSDRSLIATSDGIRQAKIALKGVQLNQTTLAVRLDCTRQPISKFFNGKTVRNDLFVQICETLNLDWQEVCGLKTNERTTHPIVNSHKNSVEATVQSIRDAIRPRIIENHGKIKVLDIEKPIDLKDFYININILEKLPGRTRSDLIKMMQERQYDEVDISYDDLTIMMRQPRLSDELNRFSYGPIKERNVPGLKTVSENKKLLVLGRPGAGKTTFLKYLAIQCIEGDFQSHCIPVLIELKEFAEAKGQPALLEYMSQFIPTEGVQDLTALLDDGRILVLLDGLDEVCIADTSRLLQEIKQFSDSYFNNHFVMTCRIAALEYKFNSFKEIEIDDFGNKQIIAFSEKWFSRKNNKFNTDKFLDKLKTNPQIIELAKTPKLLALLCLVFEELNEFPAKRSRLYHNAIKILIKKGVIHRKNRSFYQKLLTKQKEKLFSYIAYKTFKQEDYFFDIEYANKLVGEFLSKLPSFNSEELEIDEFMNAIESQNGLIIERAHEIYSFSHLTFQEYFTAREIIESSDRSVLLTSLVQNVFEVRWEEVFLLVIEMLSEPDGFLLSVQDMINNFVAEEEEIQEVINWAYQKTQSQGISYTQVEFRLLYLHFLGYGYIDEITNALNLEYPYSQNIDSILFLLLKRTWLLNSRSLLDFFAEIQIPNRDRVAYLKELVEILETALSLSYKANSNLWSSLTELKEKLFKPTVDDTECKQWWQMNGHAWEADLRAILVPYLGIDIQNLFNEDQDELWIQYLRANLLLVNCLNKASNIDHNVREEIKSTLLLPISVIKSCKLAKRK